VLHGAALGARVVAAVLSLLVLVGSGWAWATYRSFSADIKRVNAISKKGSTPNIDGKDQNILIVGNDDRDSASDAELRQLGTTRDGGTYNTDTMMLLHVPADGSKATVISFPRDSYVDIPGHGKHKLNSAYPDGVRDANGNKDGGAALLVKTIEGLTGLTVDHFVQVDLLGFFRISNAIGGVDVCLNEAQKEANSGIDLPKGHSVIKGTQALAFVRQRYGLPAGDLDRIKRQQYFLSAVFRKMSSAGTLLNPFKLQNLLKAVTKSLLMDQSLDPLKLAQQMQNLQAGNVKFTTIPTNGTSDTPNDGNVVVVNREAMPDFIDTLIGTDPSAALNSAKAADPSTVTVTVINDANTNGLETTNSKALQQAGFKTQVPASTSDVMAKTTIRYSAGQESAAKALQLQVPGAVMVRTHDNSGVTLLLGNNGVQVKSLMSTSQAPTGSSGSQAGSSSASSSSSSGTTVTTAADAGCIN
jgi:LCP family protein required for cell wall assembly